jgi:hypothetical protein
MGLSSRVALLVVGRSDTLKLFLVQRSDGSVRGAAFSRSAHDRD